MISENLSCGNHVDYVIDNASIHFESVYEENTLKNAHKSYKILHTCLWTGQHLIGKFSMGPHLKKDTIIIDQIQRRAARFITNDNRVYIN